MIPSLSAPGSNRPSPTRTLQRVIACLAVLFAFLALALPASASLILSTPDETSGTGLGAVNTVLTLQETPENDRVESGCVEFDGAGDVSGAAVCPSGFQGGDEAAQTQTRTLSEVGLTSAFNLRLVFNYNEPQSGTGVDNITIEDLVLTLFETDGSLCFDSGAFTPQTFQENFGGTGTAGFVFRLDTTQAADAQSCFGDPQNRIGLAARVSGADQGPETFYIADAADLLPTNADLEVTKSDSADPVNPGDTFTYNLEVTNNGPNAATGVEVTDTLPSDVTFVSANVTTGSGTCTQNGRIVNCALGDIPSGETFILEIVVTAGSQGTLTNSVLVSGDQPDPNPGNNSDSEDTTVTGGTPSAQADVSVVKTDTPDPVAVGATLTYTLTVRNSGPDTADGVTVTDQLPASVTFVSATANDESGDGTDGCSQSGRTVSCELGDLAPGEVETVTIEVTPTATGRIDNFAQVGSDATDTNPDNNTDDETTTVVANPPADQVDLVLTKTDSADPVNVFDDFTYTLLVENRGTTDATGVTITDTLPASANFLSASPECSYSGSGTGGTVTCDLGALAAGDSDSVTITVDVSAGPTFVTNSAVVTADQDDISPGDNSDTETTEVQDGAPGVGSADLAVTKTDSTDPVGVGSQFAYALTVSNGGPDTATGVTLTDNLPSEVSYVSDDSGCTHDGAVTGGTVTCDLGTLAAGTATTVTITVEAEEVGFADDFASVAGEQSDPDTGNNTATERTTIGSPPGTLPSADLSLIKSDSPDPATVGGTLTYSITVTNDGPDAATGVMVSDNLPATVSCQVATSGDGTCSCPAASLGGTVSCDLGTLASGASALITIQVEPTEEGVVLNTAVVSGNEPDPDTTNNSDEAETDIAALAAPIPTLAEYMLALLGLLLLTSGIWILRR